MAPLHGQHLLILGAGQSGLAMARWGVRCGAASVVVADSRTAPPQADALTALPGVRLRGGGFPPDLLEGIDRVLKSPGLAPGDPALAPLLLAAAQHGLPVHGELALFAAALQDLRQQHGYQPQVLAITGTNGKTTTTAMTAALVARAGARVAMAGNIGPTMLDTLADALDREALGAAPAAAPATDRDGASTDATVDAVADGVADAVADVVADVVVDGLIEAAQDEPADLATAEPDLPRGGPPPHLRPPPPPGPVFQHLPEVWVLELSSFQLDRVEGFEPSAAAVLNLTQDHLDWHGSMDAYGAAKARVFGQHAVMVINRDDPLVEAMVPPPLPLPAKGRGRAARPREVGRTVRRFGLGLPTRPGDYGVQTEGGIAWLVRALPPEPGETTAPLPLQRLMPAEALRVRGRHNAANALAALALAQSAGLPLAPMLHALRDYRGEPHRVELLGPVGGVEAYDDSKGTNVGATVAAIDGLGADKAPARLLLVLGGDGKGQDFTPLAAPVTRHARAVALIGRDAGLIAAALHDCGVPLQHHDSLPAATRWCFEQAQPGDAVLLSPACASLDMFRNYAHRAQVFIDTVRDLAAERGECWA